MRLAHVLQLWHMAGRRPLSEQEERDLLRVARSLPPRNRALITTQWFTGFRISEVLSLTVGRVQRCGAIVDKIGITPQHLKGGFGPTRWVPMVPELHRALRVHLAELGRKFPLTPELPLFVSRKSDGCGRVRALSRLQAAEIITSAFAAAGIHDDGRLGTHSLRKTWARRVYAASGHDLIVLREALRHRSVATTEMYLEVDEASVQAAMRACDFTARGRQRHLPPRARKW